MGVNLGEMMVRREGFCFSEWRSSAGALVGVWRVKKWQVLGAEIA